MKDYIVKISETKTREVVVRAASADEAKAKGLEKAKEQAKK